MMIDMTSCLLLDTKFPRSLQCHLDPYFLSPVGMDPSLMDTDSLSGSESDSYQDYIDLACHRMEDLEEPESVITDVSFANSRAAVIDWMIWGAQEFCLGDKILMNAVAMLNRFLGKSKVSDILLYGVTSLWISSKLHDEIYQLPLVSEFMYLCKSRYSCEQLMDAEVEIMNAISFNIAEPTVATFCDLVLSQVPIDQDFSTFVSLFCNSIMFSTSPYKPSQLALAVIALSKMATEMPMNIQVAVRMLTDIDPDATGNCMLYILELTKKVMDPYGTGFDLKFGNFISRIGFSPESLISEIAGYVKGGAVRELLDNL